MKTINNVSHNDIQYNMGNTCYCLLNAIRNIYYRQNSCIGKTVVSKTMLHAVLLDSLICLLFLHMYRYILN